MISSTKETQQNPTHQEAGVQRKKRVSFLDDSREEHLRILREWLHPDLRDLPGINWAKLPSQVIGYFVRTVKDAPHAPHIALAAGAACGGVGASTLRSFVSNLHRLLSFLQKHCSTGDDIQLTREVWEKYASLTESSSTRRTLFVSYSAATERHLPDYVERLDPATRTRIAPYLLPQLPARFLEQYGAAQKIGTEQKKRRKEKSDILVPLHSILVALVQFRKQEAQRLLQVFQEAVRRVETGETLPLAFSYEEVLAKVNHDAQTVAELRLEKKPVLLTFTLWNRRTWTQHHPEDFSRTSRRRAEKREGTHEPENDRYFVEYLGDPAHLLWFGDLVQNGLLRSLNVPVSKRENLSEKDLQQLNLAQSFGVGGGFAHGRPGLLTPSGGFGQWLTRYILQPSRALVFEPESLYRGVLYGSALATLALTNGSRLTELLQVSADRFKGHVYEKQSQAQKSRDQRVIMLQHLLPKGRKTEAERQLFPISPQAYELLREIGSLLKKTHGCIPTIHPHPTNTKADDLQPERYLFQWEASPDGRAGAINPADVGTLIRFILHGLEFRTMQGERFTVSAHLLRHVMATAARHEYEVPAEVIAFVLHHQQLGLALPVATEYYSQMPEEQRLKILAEFLIELEEQAANVLLSLPNERTLEHMDEDLREVFERWQTLLETAFGFCGCAGLCPRGYHRSLCIGCPHLIPDPRKRESAVKWRESYARQTQELEAEGAAVDAKQARLQVQELDNLLNSMDVMQQAIDDGARKPAFLQLSSAPYDAVVIDAEA